MDREMQFEINRRVVQEGLNRRAEERQAAIMEAALDAFEDEMILHINKNYDEASLTRHIDDTARLDLEAVNARMNERAEKNAEIKQIRKDSRLGRLIFTVYAIVIAWLTTWTHLPVWVAVLYIVMGAFFLFLYMCDVHGAFERGGKK